MQRRVLLLVGPTAVGKTAVSLKLAPQLQAEIVSADSRQVYRFMDIGTAKPTREERESVPHHFIDIKNPDEYYSAGQFGREARERIDTVFARGRQPIVVGGSGLYIRALVDGLFEPGIKDERIKQSLKKQAHDLGVAELYGRLQRLDPETAARLHATDTQRILRALEVYEITGVPFSKFLERPPASANFVPLLYGLTMERSTLYERIEERTDRMLARGFLNEVRDLRRRGYGPDLNAMNTVGYKEADLFLDGELSHDEMVRLFKQRSRNYAKRQLTWFRKDERIKWFQVDSGDFMAVLMRELGQDLLHQENYA